MWIWYHLAPENLPLNLTREFERPNAEFGISSISIWETMVAIEKGRVETTQTAEGAVRSWLAASPFSVIPVDAEIALLSRTLQFHHQDPADRFIAATSALLDCPLATADNQLKRLPWLKVLD